MALSIGYAHKRITPSPERPAHLAGFGQNRPAESIHDPLSVRAMALADPPQYFALAACGRIGLANDETGYILPDESYSYPEIRFNPATKNEETTSIGPRLRSLLLQSLLPLIQA